jgi:hypothetical protein
LRVVGRAGGGREAGRKEIKARVPKAAKEKAARLAKIDKLLEEASDMMAHADYENAAKTYALAVNLDPQATHPRHDEILLLQTDATRVPWHAY